MRTPCWTRSPAEYSEAALMYSRHTESESQPSDFSRGCLLFVLNTSASLSHLADPATDFELRRRRRTDVMDYGVPAALGVSPELMEEVSTGVSAHPPFKKDVPSQIQPSFPPTTRSTDPSVFPLRPSRPRSWRACTTVESSWEPTAGPRRETTSRTEPRTRSRR